jgi:predicted ABC-type ATPase
MMSASSKKIVIIAGPNGAGKTTFAREFLPREAGCPVFVNADLIAAGLSPFHPEAAAFRAGRMMLEEIRRHAADGRNFAFETTLAGLSYVRMINEWRTAGFAVKLIFLSLATPEEAIARVAMRVRQGGHNVPPEVIRRRFASRAISTPCIAAVLITGNGSTIVEKHPNWKTKVRTHD